MRDIALLVILVGFCALSISRAWLGVVCLALVGAMHPQSFASDWMAGFPAYKLLFLATCIGVAVDYWRTHRLLRFQWNWQLAVLALLFADFALTSHFAMLPDTARTRLVETGMLLPPLLLTLWLIDTREKLRALVIVTAVGIALVALKGGYWAIIGGFKERVYGPPGSQIGDNNAFAVALAMTIPLLVLWWRQSADRVLRWVIGTMIALCYIAALTSWSRGGLVTLAAMSALLVWHGRRKFLGMALLATGVAVVLVAMPEAWHSRMESIASHGSDQSFQGRVEAWRQGLAYVQHDPWTGSGFDGWRAITAKFTDVDSPPSVIDWHSAYVEVLVEHGIPGFLLWSALLVGTLFHLSRMVVRVKRQGDVWAADHGAMLQASLVAFAAGGITLGISYWELYFQILTIAWIALRLGQDTNSSTST